MTINAEAVLREALALPDKDRADVAAQLLANLHAPDDEDVVAVGTAWSEELDRRGRRALSGQHNGEDWASVGRRLADDLAVEPSRSILARGVGGARRCPLVREEQHDGLGLAFPAAVDNAVELLLRWPHAGAPVAGVAAGLDVRRVKGSAPGVKAVAHGRRALLGRGRSR